MNRAFQIMLGIAVLLISSVVAILSWQAVEKNQVDENKKMKKVRKARKAKADKKKKEEELNSSDNGSKKNND